MPGELSLTPPKLEQLDAEGDAILVLEGHTRDVGTTHRPLDSRTTTRGNHTLSQTGRMQQDGLTHRQRQILEFVAQGFTNPEISEVLALAPSTVKMHRRSGMRELGAKSRADVVQWAISTGRLAATDAA
jgi:DNA-binding CsgD family transcriptional regulator